MLKKIQNIFPQETQIHSQKIRKMAHRKINIHKLRVKTPKISNKPKKNIYPSACSKTLVLVKSRISNTDLD